MLPQTIELTSEDRRMLVDLGFIALSARLDQKALAIFLGVQAATPSEEAGYIGQALVYLNQGHPQRAVDLLRSLPPSDAVTLFLGIATAKTGDRGEARHLLKSVISTPGGSPHAETAAAALAELD